MNFTQAWLCCQLRDLIQCFHKTASHGGGMVSQKINLPPIGQVVKAWRVDRGLTGTALGARAGLPRAYISQVEHGKVHQPGDENLARIASALNIPVEHLVLRRLPEKDVHPGEAAEGKSGKSTTRKRQRAESGFGFDAPNVSKRHAAGRSDVLREILREIAEMNRRTEEIRRVVEELLRSEEQER
jgi:transcriptional regulator with XRE-family HTH domain